MIPSQPLIEVENCQSVFGATRLLQDGRAFPPDVLIAVRNRDQDDFRGRKMWREGASHAISS